MKIQNLERVKVEIDRFLEKASQVTAEAWFFSNNSPIPKHKVRIADGKEAAALRRASLDLSRALSNLRKSDYED